MTQPLWRALLSDSHLSVQMGASHPWTALLGGHSQLCSPGAPLPLLRGFKVTDQLWATRASWAPLCSCVPTAWVMPVS